MCRAGGGWAGVGWVGRPGLVRLGRIPWAFGFVRAGRRDAPRAGLGLTERAHGYAGGWLHGMGLVGPHGVVSRRWLAGLARGWQACWHWLHSNQKKMFAFKIKKIMDIYPGFLSEI